MAVKKQRGLGRGLGALIDDFAVSEEQGAVTKLPIQKIEPNPNQPRKQFDDEAFSGEMVFSKEDFQSYKKLVNTYVNWK